MLIIIFKSDVVMIDFELCTFVSSMYFSSCSRQCDPRDLSVMDEVEYCIVRKNGKLAADEVMKLPKGTIQTEVGWVGWVKRSVFLIKAHYINTLL